MGPTSKGRSPVLEFGLLMALELAKTHFLIQERKYVASLKQLNQNS